MYKSQHVITLKHYLVLCIISFALGMYIYAQLPVLPALIIILLSTIAFASLLTVKMVMYFTKHRSGNFYSKLTLILVLISFLMLGIFRIYTSESAVYNSINKHSGTENWVYGRVVSDPTLTSKGYSCTFQLDTVQIGKDSSARGTIIVYGPAGQVEKIQLGDNIYFWATIERPELLETDPLFDYYMSLSSKNIFVTADTNNINLYPGSFSTSPISYIKDYGQRIRNLICSSIDKMITNDPTASAILKGILIGDKSDFTDEMYTKFANAGISHVVAVSGLHISILFSFLAIMFATFKLNKRISLYLTIPFILIFMSASAFTPSVCRASIMILITVLGILCHEEYDPITALFLALGIIIAVSPYSLFSKSLVLSFTATLGIFVYLPYLDNLTGIKSLEKLNTDKLFSKNIFRIVQSLRYSVLLSVSTFFGTVYFILMFFGKISYVQFLTNLWIIPTVTFTFCIGYVVCAFSYILPFAAKILTYPLMLLLNIIKATINAFGSDKYSLTVPAHTTALPYSLWWFAGLLIIYLVLKALSDTKTESKKAAERFGRL